MKIHTINNLTNYIKYIKKKIKNINKFGKYILVANTIARLILMSYLLWVSLMKLIYKITNSNILLCNSLDLNRVSNSY